jgi:hypothetical protein
VSRMLAMEKHVGDEDLCGSGRRSVTPNVHERFCCIVVCVQCSSRELDLRRVGVV